MPSAVFALVCIIVYETPMRNIFMVMPNCARHGSFVTVQVGLAHSAVQDVKKTKTGLELGNL